MILTIVIEAKQLIFDISARLWIKKKTKGVLEVLMDAEVSIQTGKRLEQLRIWLPERKRNTIE